MRDRRPSPRPAGSLRPAVRRHRRLRDAASGQNYKSVVRRPTKPSVYHARQKRTQARPVGPAESSRPLTGGRHSVRHPIRVLATSPSPVIDMEIPTTRPCPPRSCTATDRKICRFRFGFRSSSVTVLSYGFAHFGSSNGSK